MGSRLTSYLAGCPPADQVQFGLLDPVEIDRVPPVAAGVFGEGYKRGTGGFSGVNFLQKALDLKFFPELLDVRTEL